ncbi:hypothetical protein ACFU8R_20275 [Pseudonocardia alni]|uniref:hypothetical protein n=1 Tax=Pseudonocardia alni TaxID=33907 RepID=UPI0036A0F360
MTIKRRAAESVRAASTPPGGRSGPIAQTRNIEILGRCRVDGVPVRGVKAIELVTALAVAGGRMHRDGLRSRVYEHDIADSTLPTLAYRARQMGVDVRFDRERCEFSLTAMPDIDVLRVFALITSGHVAEALELCDGPCLPTSRSPLADALRHSLESRLAEEVLRTGDPRLIEAAACRIDTWSLAEPAMRGDDPAVAVLGRSYLSGCGLLPGA